MCSPKTSTIWRCLFNVSLISFPWLMFIQEKLHSNTENRPLQSGGEGRCELLPWFPCSPFTTEIGTKRAGKTHSQYSWQVSRLCETQIVLERAEPSTEHPHKNWWTSFCGRNSQVGCTLWTKPQILNEYDKRVHIQILPLFLPCRLTNQSNLCREHKSTVHKRKL